MNHSDNSNTPSIPYKFKEDLTGKAPIYVLGSYNTYNPVQGGSYIGGGGIDNIDNTATSSYNIDSIPAKLSAIANGTTRQQMSAEVGSMAGGGLGLLTGGALAKKLYWKAIKNIPDVHKEDIKNAGKATIDGLGNIPFAKKLAQIHLFPSKIAVGFLSKLPKNVKNPFLYGAALSIGGGLAGTLGGGILGHMSAAPDNPEDVKD